MRAAQARKIRSAIISARERGWSSPPDMNHQPGRPLAYSDALYGRAWERTMRGLGLYPPRPPRGRSGISRPIRGRTFSPESGSPAGD